MKTVIMLALNVIIIRGVWCEDVEHESDVWQAFNVLNICNYYAADDC